MNYKIWDSKYRCFLSKKDTKDFTFKFDANGHIQEPNLRFCFLKSSEMVDKKGREIFEGDVIKTVDGEKEVVEYYSAAFRYSSIGLFLANTYIDNDAKKREVSSVEVLGNIYEKPDLIKWSK
jgi:hypothetical protein